MSYLDNIKALASELANMAPKTQLELIKLCKDLCINTKNYLVAFDETTLPALNSRIDALETLTTNLSTELETAEGNIQANANAIVEIQDAITTINSAIDTIQTALSNVYTKNQIDTMLASYYTTVQIDTMLANYYNKMQIDTALNGKANVNDVYSKSQVDTALSGKASLSNENIFDGYNEFNDAKFKGEVDLDFAELYDEEGAGESLETKLQDLQNDIDNLENVVANKQNKLSLYGIYYGDSEEYNFAPIYIINAPELDKFSASDLTFDFDNSNVVNFETYNNIEALYTLCKAINDNFGTYSRRALGNANYFTSFQVQKNNNNYTIIQIDTNNNNFKATLIKNGENYSVDTTDYIGTGYFYLTIAPIIK